MKSVTYPLACAVVVLGAAAASAQVENMGSASTITQPPIYALAVVELSRRGVEVPAEVVERAVAGLWFLLRDRRRSRAGLIELVHPWESGCDHSPRWDDLMSPGSAVRTSSSIRR